MAKAKQVQYYEGIGRRKESVARVRLYLMGKEKVTTVEGIKIQQGEIYVNKKNITEVFNSSSERVRLAQPFKVTNNEERFSVSAHITGGGHNGQLESLILGIARALEKTDKETVSLLVTLKSAKDVWLAQAVKHEDRSSLRSVNIQDLLYTFHT